MKKIHFIILLVLIYHINAIAQNSETNFKKFKTSYLNAVEVHLDSAHNLVNNYLNTFTEEVANKKTEKFLADILFRKGQQKKADSIYQKLLPWFIKNTEYQTTLSIYNYRCSVLRKTGKLIEALSLAEEVQAYIKKNDASLQSHELQISIAAIHRVTGIIYAIQAETDDTFNQETSLAYFKKTHQILVPLKEYKLEGGALFNIGNVMPSEDSTVYYWKEALKVFDAHGLEKDKAQVYENLGVLHLDKKEYKKGLEFLNKSKSYNEKLDAYDTTLFALKYGEAYLGLKEYDKGIKELQKGLAIGIKNDLSLLNIKIYEFLIQGYKDNNRYKDALDTYIKYDSLLKKVDRLETERIFRDTEAKYNTKEHKDEIKILKQSKQLNTSRIKQQRLYIIVIAITLLLILFAGYFFWKQSKNRKKINNQLQKLDKDRTRFLVNISHELRTPITLIHAPLQDTIIQLEKKNYKRVFNNLQKITNNTQKLLQLTDEIVDISKIDEGFLAVKTNPIVLQTYLQRIFYAFESLATRQEIKWISNIEITKTTYEIDDNKLEKILNNLFSNALKHTPKNGKVLFSANIDNNNLICTVKDSGKGIEANNLAKIFNRYYQEEGLEKASGGLGIGLSLVKELIDILKGEIKVTSQLNKETVFTISIPVVTSTKKALEKYPTISTIIHTENRPNTDLSNTEKPHILVVEDNPEMSDFIQQLLSDEYRVSLAKNGREGIERLHANTFDLITVDVMMPEMNGIEFVTKLKEHTHWKNISTIMITALSGETDRIEGLQLGIDDYIPKPFSVNELKARVANLINNGKVRKNAITNDTSTIVGTEKQFLQKAKDIVKAQINNNDFSVKDLANHVNLSERQANRTLKKLTGLSCLQFIREVRLQHAYLLLESRKYATIAEITYAVGFENASYFTRIFTKRFGKKPSEML